MERRRPLNPFETTDEDLPEFEFEPMTFPVTEETPIRGSTILDGWWSCG